MMPLPFQVGWREKKMDNQNSSKPFFDIDDLGDVPENKSSAKVTPNTPQNMSGTNGKVISEYIAIEPDMIIIDDNEDSNTAESLHALMDEGDKYDVHCPFPEHEDKNPSAFVNMQANNKMFICCLSCGRKGFYPGNTQLKSMKGVVIPSIDKEAIIAEIGIEPKPMKAIITDMVTALPKIERNESINLEATDYVNNLLENALYPISKVNGDLRIYHDGHWQSLEPENSLRHFIKLMCVKSNGKRPEKLKLLIDNVLGEILEEYLPVEPVDGQVAINMKSNVLTITDGQFSSTAHDLSYGFLYKLQFDHQPEIDTSYIYSFLLEAVEEPEALDVLFEFLGSALIPNEVLNMEKMLILAGNGSNGKSVALSLFKSALGIENTSTLELHEFSNDNKLQVTIGKLLNIGTEIDSKRIDPSLVKRLASGEPITVDKKYGASFTITTFPKLIFATNNLPSQSNDVSKGYFRRFLIIPFEREFDHENKTENFMPDLLEHRPAILQLMLEGAMRLVANGRFTHSDKIARAGKQFENAINSIQSFITDCQVTDALPSDVKPCTTGPDLYQQYSVFCMREGLQAKSKRQLLDVLNPAHTKDYKSGNVRGIKVIVRNPPVPEYINPFSPTN